MPSSCARTSCATSAWARTTVRAAREGTDEIGLAVMATTFAICAVFVPVAFMGGIVGKFFYPFGITVVVAVLVSLFVSFTLDPMLSAVWKDPPSTPHEAAAGAGGHAIRATDRFMDALHAVYERLIRWAFSARRCRAALAHLRPPVRQPRATATRTQPRRWRRATLTPRGVVVAIGVLSFVGALGAGAAGRQRVHSARPTRASRSCRSACRSARSLERSDAKVRQVEDVVRDLRRGRDRSRPASAAPAKGCRRAQPGHAEPDAEAAQRAQAQPEAGRGRDPQADRQHPRHRRVGGLQPADLRGDARQRRRGPGARGHRLRREGEEDPRHRRCRAVGQARPAGLRGAAEGRCGARTRPDRAAAGVVAARLRQRRGRDLLDHARRRPGRGAAAPARRPARTHRADAQAAGGLRQGRHADRAGQRGHDRARWPTPRSSAARTCSAARPSSPASRAGRPARSATTVQKLVKDTQLPPGYSFDVGGQTQAAGRSLRRDAGGDGAGGDLHLHRAGQPVRQLRAADRHHGHRCRWR